MKDPDKIQQTLPCQRALLKLNYALLMGIMCLYATVVSAQTSNTMIVDWGDDTFDQLFPPFQNLNVTDVATGFEHSLAILDGSTVIAWGDNTYGQLNVPGGIVNPVKVAAGLGHSVVLQGDGTVVAWGFNEFGQSDVSTLTDVIDIGAGDEHTVVLHADGTVTTISGKGATYDLDPPAGLSDVTAIASGHFHIVALINDGTVVSWGANEFGQADVPAGLTDVIAVDAGLFHSMALRSDGTVQGWGDNELFTQLDAPSGFPPFNELSVGSFHNIVLYGTGELTSWGSNRFKETEIPDLLQGREISLITAGFAHNTVIATNQAPTAISIPDTIFVSEDVEAETVIALLGATDPDILDDHLYTLVPGVGDDDNASFQTVLGTPKPFINDDLLWGQLTGDDRLLNLITFDYETDSIYRIRLRAIDLGGLSVEKPVVIKIRNVNDPPLALELSDNEIFEQQPVGTFIGTFSTQDTDLFDSFTYSLVSGNGSDDNASFTIDGDRLLSNEVFVEAEQNTYLIRVRSTDSGGSAIEEQFAVRVLPFNRAPTDILLSNNVVTDDSPVGALVGFFTTVDPDTEDNHTYALVSGTGDADNASFRIESNTLLTNEEFNAEIRDRYSIRVSTTDDGEPASLSFEKVFEIQILSSNVDPVIEDQVFSVREDVPDDTQIGLIIATDDGAITYTIISGNGDRIFSLDDMTGILTVADASQLDALTTPSYDLGVRVTDASGRQDQATVTVNVVFVPAPPIVQDQSFEMDENVEEGTLIGTLVASSPKDNPLVFEVQSGNEEGIFALSADGELSVADNSTLDARITPFYQFIFRVTDDRQGLSTSAVATVRVIDVNNPPTDIMLDNNTIDEQLPVGSRVGLFSTIDEDFSDIHTYTLVDGDGADDNGQFSILESFLVSNQVFDARQSGSFSIRVRSTDNGNPNLFVEEIFRIIVNPLDLPEIPTAITANGDLMNDVWEITNLDLYPQCTVEVYNAAGQPVFTSQGYQTPWDGTFNGSVLPAASYYYIIELNNAVETRFSGTITILK